MSSIWFILGGVVLRLNSEWFNGAPTIGLVLIIFGVLIFIIEAFIFISILVTSKDNW